MKDHSPKVQPVGLLRERREVGVRKRPKTRRSQRKRSDFNNSSSSLKTLLVTGNAWCVTLVLYHVVSLQPMSKQISDHTQVTLANSKHACNHVHQ